MPTAPNPLQIAAQEADAPAQGFVNITPSDTTDLPESVRQIRVGAGGTLRFVGLRGDTIQLTVVDGESVAGWIKRVYQTGTTATGLVGAL